MESIDFWQRNYDELRPENDQPAKRAYEIFDRLIRAAGSRPGVVPRLFIAKSEPKIFPSYLHSRRFRYNFRKDPGNMLERPDFRR